jgi:oxygen-independent coproporphyrinogen-3 oxidase
VSGGFGLYVHWPFCASKCPYCDFNSHVAVTIDQGRWAAAYEREIARLGAETGPRVLRSVFFGGGTPSLMEPEVVDRVLRAARAVWPFANDVEVTLEANPTSVEAGRFADYAAAGVNRVSMGVQALRDADLRRLGRMHTVAEAQAAFDVARGLFGRVSFDLIYARQDQTVAEWRAELGEAMAMAVDHLSLYQLTIEDGTVFGARFAAGQLRGLPDEDRAGAMWDVTQEATAAAGLGAYEVSNHARDGAESRHNLIYWRYGDYAGVGPGAHGRLTLGGVRWATEGPRAPGAWLAAAEAGVGEVARERLSVADQRVEFLLMGMRLREGVEWARLERFGIDDISININGLIDMGVIEVVDGRLRTTAAGRPVLNAVLRGILGA